MNILNNQQNKELLWNMLYKNKVFNNIPNQNIDEVKNIFENTITFTINNMNIVNQNLNKQELLEYNKILLTKLNSEINLFKNKNQLVKNTPITDFSKINNQTTKDDLKNEKVLIFDRNLEERKKNMDSILNVSKPKEIDFSDKTDNPIDEENMNNLLERMQKERNIIVDNNIFDNNIINNINKDMDKKNVITQSSEINISPVPENQEDNNIIDTKNEEIDTIKEPNKIKISNIDDLLNNNTSSLDNFEDDYFIKRNSRVSKDDIDKVIYNEYKNEFNNNILNKLDNLSNKINKILETQNIILERLNNN